MGEPRRTELSVRAERALLVGVMLPGSTADPQDPLGELRNLARTAGAEVVDEMLARREAVHAGLYVGTGKAQEIADRAAKNDADVVIFDNDLAPNQIRRLEELAQRKVLDRSELILDIFAAHARTNESLLQVELAQLEYTYPRLSHMWTHLERVAGGATSGAAAVGGIGTRGPGEKQLEIDRRLVQKRISHLKRQLERIGQRRGRMVSARSEAFSVCLVGYTNAGKSTLMNRLTGAGVLVADQLFSTLETRTRRWRLGARKSALLSDTVGFIRDLPHHLVASFRSTLEEAIDADLLLHVADASHPRLEHQIRAVDGVLKELGCEARRQLLVLNKIDRVNDPAEISILRGRYPLALLASAGTGEGLDALRGEVASRAEERGVRVTLEADCRNGRLMQYIARHGQVMEQAFDDSTARIEAVFSSDRVEGLRAFGDSVRIIAQAEN
jgi:GTPase